MDRHQLSCHLVHLSGFLPCSFYEWPRITRVLLRCLSFWWDFCCRAWFQEVFSFVWGTFSFFLSSLLVWWCPLLIFPSTCNFPFLQVFSLFLELSVLFLKLFFFYHVSLWAWYIFICHIPLIYPGNILQLFVSESPILLVFFSQIAWCRPCTLGDKSVLAIL